MQITKERSPSAFLWGLSLLGSSEADVIHEACVEGLVHVNAINSSALSSVSSNELASLWSSVPALGASNPQFQRSRCSETDSFIFAS